MGVPGILGHERVLASLIAALDDGALHHAYLFEGPRGVGKDTVARRLAQAANCTAAPVARPCGECGSCRQIAAGTHADVIRLEPDPERASGTIAVDDVREVVRRTGYRRYTGRHRFVIVDPAEAMLPAAANALLKTLEEPPAGTGFVLLCTNAGALLPTILSRCQRVRFGSVPHDQVRDWLIARGHAERAERAARLSLGCPGRALALAEGELAERDQLRGELLTALVGDPQARFAWAQKLVDNKKRNEWAPRVELVLELIEDLVRDAVVSASGADLPLLNDDEAQVVRTWATRLWPDGARRVREAIQETRDNLDVMVSGRLALDALLARVAAELAAT